MTEHLIPQELIDATKQMEECRRRQRYPSLKEAIELSQTESNIQIEIDDVVYTVGDRLESIKTGQTLTLFYIMNNLDKEVELINKK